MSDPITIMNEIERSIVGPHPKWHKLRKAVEAQTELLKAMEWHRDELDKESHEQAVELAQAKQWINDLQSGMYINCVYCGHRYGPESEVPASMADVLKEHIEQCPEHPMSKLKEELAKRNEQIIDMLGTGHELEQARARVARLEQAIEDSHRPDIMLPDWLELLDKVLDESPRQSLAAVKAEALREAARRTRLVTIEAWLLELARDIEREAKEES